LIEPGWRVEGSDGEELGRVEEVSGDEGADIFDGLAVAGGVMSRPRYVPAEQVAGIVDGTVTLTLDREAFEQLTEYREPPESERIEPDKASLLQRAESAVTSPPVHGGRIPLLRRVLLWFGRAGRR
jgi:Uncharacterized protein conserved in bacteria (DUF2171)